ncbi:MAG: hypothetical protein WC517_02120 [Patescibacteria group bacterium]
MAAEQSKKWEPINFVFYLSLVKWPVLAAVLAEILLRWLIGRFLDDWSLGRIDLLMWLVRLAALFFIGWRIGKAYGEVPPMGATAGATAGFLIGLAAAVFRFNGGFHTWKIFNLITEPALTVLVGGLAVFLVVYIWDLLPKGGKIEL